MTTEPTPDAPAPTPEPKPEPTPAKTPDVDRLPDDHPVVVALAKANKEAQEARLKLKDLEPIAAKAKELEEAQKTNEQRLTEALDAAKADATSSKAQLMRLQVGLDKGVPAALVKFLPSGTQEEVEAAADELLANLPASDAPRRPQPSPDQGRQPVSKDDPDAWLREMARK